MSAVHRLGDVVIGHKCEVDNCLLPAMNGQSRCYEHSEDRLIEDLFRGENCRFAGVNCTVQATACNEHDVPMCANCLGVYNRIQNGLRNAGVVTEGYHLADYQQINREMEGPEYAQMRAHYQQLAQRIDQPELLPPNHRWPQRPRGGTVRYNGRRMRNDELREAMNRDMMNRMNASMQNLREQQPQGVLSDIVASGEVRTSPLGNTYRYFGDGPPGFGHQPPPTGVHPTDMGHETDEELCECNNLEHSEFNEECPLNNVGEVCWGHRGPCDNYSVTYIEEDRDDDGNEVFVPLCNNCYRSWIRARIEGDERA